jgi:hypothetical protein
MTEPVIHIGYGKAGSTTLQTHIFPKHPGIYFWGINLHDPDGQVYRTPASESITLTLVNPDRFLGFSANDREELAKSLQVAAQQKKVFVFSNENFSETPSAYLTAQQIKELFPNGKILIVIRNQIGMIKSLYKYYAHSNIFAPGKFYRKYVPFNDWFSYARYNFKKRGGHQARDRVGDFFRIIDFNLQLSAYEKFFGRDKICVLLFEDLKETPAEFYRKLATFVGVDFDDSLIRSIAHRAENVGPTLFMVRLAKLKSLLGGSTTLLSDKSPIRKMKLFAVVNRFLRSRQGRLDLSPEQRMAVQEMFGAGNFALSERYGLNLAARGYPVVEKAAEISPSPEMALAPAVAERMRTDVS